MWTTGFTVDRWTGRRLNGVIGRPWNWRHVWTGYWRVDTGSRRSLRVGYSWGRSWGRSRDLHPAAIAFPLSLGFVLSTRTETTVSIQNSQLLRNVLQARSKSAQKGSVTIQVEILHGVTLENDIARLKEGDAVSNGHVLQLDLVILGLRPSIGRLPGAEMTYLKAEGGIFEIKLRYFSVLYRVQFRCPVTELEAQH